MRRWRSVPTAAAVLLGVALAVTGCSSPQQRYRVLSFFFDGVPTPEEEAAAKAAAEAKKAEKSGDPKAIKGSKHKPVQERRCGECHGVSERDAELRSFSGIDMRNIDLAWKSCKSCHSDPQEVSESSLIFRPGAWLHGPIALGECKSCHVGHRSEHPHLLRSERIEAACRACHTTVGKRQGTMADLDCIACHDPHSAAKASDVLLRGGLAENCAQCHAVKKERELAWLHGPVAAGTCSSCHDAHGGETSKGHVRRPLRPVCMQCHDATELSQEAHPEVSEKECDTCHAPHAAHKADDLFLRERIGDDVGSVFSKPPTKKSEGADAPIPPD